jgi:hypothetical protein
MSGAPLSQREGLISDSTTRVEIYISLRCPPPRGREAIREARDDDYNGLDSTGIISSLGRVHTETHFVSPPRGERPILITRDDTSSKTEYQTEPATAGRLTHESMTRDSIHSINRCTRARAFARVDL